jgi:hypothetical protein
MNPIQAWKSLASGRDLSRPHFYLTTVKGIVYLAILVMSSILHLSVLFKAFSHDCVPRAHLSDLQQYIRVKVLASCIVSPQNKNCSRTPWYLWTPATRQRLSDPNALLTSCNLPQHTATIYSCHDDESPWTG